MTDVATTKPSPMVTSEWGEHYAGGLITVERAIEIKDEVNAASKGNKPVFPDEQQFLLALHDSLVNLGWVVSHIHAEKELQERVKKYCKELEKRANKMREHLAEIDEITSGLLSKKLFFSSVARLNEIENKDKDIFDGGIPVWSETLDKAMQELATGSAEVRGSFPSRGVKSNSREDLRRLIESLGEVFEKCSARKPSVTTVPGGYTETGKASYNGDFVLFVELVYPFIPIKNKNLINTTTIKDSVNACWPSSKEESPHKK
jgi:hypothetical protein